MAIKETGRTRAWALFDEIVATAPQRDANPWQPDGDGVRFEPDFGTLELLLGVPVLLESSTQSGIPALALDVWVSYELRRAGFDADKVWPRPVAPRVLPPEIVAFINALPKAQRDELRQRVSVKGSGGVASANLLGKNYVKQVDVVISSWATGPELMISTKRMDSSFGKNAANRVEESYGDAKNLRLRHPQAALGFVYGLSAAAFDEEPDKARWLIDLLIKLGRESDAYDSVALLVPAVTAPGQDVVDPAGPLNAGSGDLLAEDPSAEALATESDLASVPRVSLIRGLVPAELEPGRFFKVMCDLILTRTPINFHTEARARRRDALG